MFALSVVTFNRHELLARVLAAIEATCPEEHIVFVTDNNSQDGTPDMLREMEKAGKLKAYCLAENMGTAGGRNAQMADWLGMDSVRIDDKVLPLCSGWLTALKAQSERYHALVSVCYDPTVAHLHRFAPILDWLPWAQEGGQGGPLMYVPGEVSAALGGADEYTDGDERCVYSWDDIQYLHRAQLLGWNYGFTFRVNHEILARANPKLRDYAMRWHPIYYQLRKEYEAGERDLFIPLEGTDGYQVWDKVKQHESKSDG